MKLMKIAILSIFFSIIFCQAEDDFVFQIYFFNENSIGAFYLSSFDMVSGFFNDNYFSDDRI